MSHYSSLININPSDMMEPGIKVSQPLKWKGHQFLKRIRRSRRPAWPGNG